jgi:CRP-like cAMP-binding protein
MTPTTLSIAPASGWPSSSNELLNAVGRDVRSDIFAHLEKVQLSVREVLYDQGQRIPYVYFPTSAAVSLISVMEEGRSVEIASVGREGLLGAAVVFGEDVAMARAIVQVPGEALRMKSASFRDVLKAERSFQEVVERYLYLLLVTVARSGGCNALHTVEQRCARWLLSMHDRANTDQFVLTQEFLAEMLGVSRPRINVVAGTLQRAGLIRYARGRVKILDRSRLEQASCECYQVMKEEYIRLAARPCP